MRAESGSRTRWMKEYGRHLAVTNKPSPFSPAIYFACKGHESAKPSFMLKKAAACWSPQTRLCGLLCMQAGTKPACCERLVAYATSSPCTAGLALTEEIAAGSVCCERIGASLARLPALHLHAFIILVDRRHILLRPDRDRTRTPDMRCACVARRELRTLPALIAGCAADALGRLAGPARGRLAHLPSSRGARTCTQTAGRRPAWGDAHVLGRGRGANARTGRGAAVSGARDTELMPPSIQSDY
jgi:hypothetical protein